jgi:hypothetical protein
MPFLHISAVRHWAVFMAVLLVLGIADLFFQPELREPSIIAFGVVAWVTLFAAGLLVIALWQSTRSVRLHRTHR